MCDSNFEIIIFQNTLRCFLNVLENEECTKAPHGGAESCLEQEKPILLPPRLIIQGLPGLGINLEVKTTTYIGIPNPCFMQVRT